MNLWSWPCVPHFGWTCVGYRDMQKPIHTCDMCGMQSVRYVYEMQHPRWPNLLDVGCGCADTMCTPYAQP